jgi:hypothetical protein
MVPPEPRLRNPGFMCEVKRLSVLSHLYDWPPAADRNHKGQDESLKGADELAAAGDSAGAI